MDFTKTAEKQKTAVSERKQRFFRWRGTGRPWFTNVLTSAGAGFSPFDPGLPFLFDSRLLWLKIRLKTVLSKTKSPEALRLQGIDLVDDTGLEPVTSRTSSGCSYQLS